MVLCIASVLAVGALGLVAPPQRPPPFYRDASQGLPEARPGPADDAGWTGIGFGDVNEDGWTDLAAIGRKGNGARVFAAVPRPAWVASQDGITPHFSGRSDLRLAPVDADAHLDVVDSMGWVFLGDGTGRWSAGPQRIPFEGEDVAFGDVDNDGDLDAALVGHLVGGLRVYLNDGAGRWTSSSAGLPTASGGHKLLFSDVDLDGCLDVVASYWYDGGVWLGDCHGRWTDRSEGLHEFQAWGVAAGDVDGDRLPDLVYATFHGRDGLGGLRVFRGDGAANWERTDILLDDETWGGLALDDVDGDGRLDIVAGNNGQQDARVVLLVGDGRGAFHEVDVDLPTDVQELEGLSVADVDHNGVLDVGLPHYGPDGVHVWVDTYRASALTARVLEPRAGDVWGPGGSREVRWASEVPWPTPPGTADVALSLDGADGPWIDLATDLPDSGAAYVRAPAAVADRAYVRVTVRAGGDTAEAVAGPIGVGERPELGP